MESDANCRRITWRLINGISVLGSSDDDTVSVVAVEVLLSSHLTDEWPRM